MAVGFGRSVPGIAAVLAVCSIITVVLAGQKLLAITCLVLATLEYSFIVYALAFGNGLADQKDYATYRLAGLASELSRLKADDKITSKKLQLTGNIGLSAVMQHVSNVYPVTSKIFDLQSGLNDLSYWGYYQLINYYNIHMEPDYNRVVKCDDKKVLSQTDLYVITGDEHNNVCVKIK